MKSLERLVLTAFFAALACACLNAQNADMRATIPFDFHAADKLMPAGEYQIREQGPCITFNRLDDRNAVQTVMTNSAGDMDGTRVASLVFNRYGSDYFLTTIWGPSSQDGRHVIPTSHEKELAKRGGRPAQETVDIASGK